jgi:hypothetical protein
MGDCPNDKHVGCCEKVYSYLVAWKGVGEDTVRSHSTCLREISQNASRREKKGNFLPKKVKSFISDTTERTRNPLPKFIFF